MATDDSSPLPMKPASGVSVGAVWFGVRISAEVAVLGETVLWDVPPWSFSAEVIVELDSVGPLEVVMIVVFNFSS